MATCKTVYMRVQNNVYADVQIICIGGCASWRIGACALCVYVRVHHGV